MLVTVARYRTVTLDTTSSDSAVSGAITAAQELLEADLDRPLEQANRTETIRLARDGRLYPKASPVTATDDTGLVVEADQRSVYGAVPDAGPIIPAFYSDTLPPYATITYTGGWTAATLPETLAREIAWRAWDLLHPGELGAYALAGASSASIGDASVSFGADGAPASATRPTRAQVRGYRRPRLP